MKKQHKISPRILFPVPPRRPIFVKIKAPQYGHRHRRGRVPNSGT